VAITISEGHGVRFLHFGSPWVQGAMRIARPWALELEYTRDMMLPLLHHDAEWPRTVLQIGLGSASVTKFLYRNRPQARITVVEILPVVVAAATQYFRMPEDPERVRVEIADGYQFVMDAKARFDLILLDGFDDKGRPGMLDTAAFYMNCRERLARAGMLSVNLLTRRTGVASSVARMREAFGDNVRVIPPSDAGNTVALASVAAIDDTPADLRPAASRLKAATGLNLLPVLSRMEQASQGA
jgi:spermidine synthase